MQSLPFGQPWDKSKRNNETTEGMPPVLQFNYTFKHPFLTMC